MKLFEKAGIASDSGFYYFMMQKGLFLALRSNEVAVHAADVLKLDVLGAFS